MQEIWKDIEGYEGYYQVSNLGNVKNTKSDKVLKPLHNGNGYFQVAIRKDGVPKKRYLVHRLVARTFFSDFSADLEVNHKNGNKADNRLCNIELVTRSENLIHRTYELEVFGIANKPKPIRCVDTGVVYRSIREAARTVKTSQSNICSCLSGKTKSAANLRWEYAG